MKIRFENYVIEAEPNAKNRYNLFKLGVGYSEASDEHFMTATNIGWAYTRKNVLGQLVAELLFDEAPADVVESLNEAIDRLEVVIDRINNFIPETNETA